jgi:tetratricopeptide (TPR) repeat protein
VLLGSLRVHPGSPATHVHLGRIYLARKDLEKAKVAYLEALASDPFDEEIHLALLRVHLGQGANELADRARHATEVLTGLRGEEVDQVARTLVREGQDLAQVALPAKSEPDKAKPEKPDAGPDQPKDKAKPAGHPKAPKPPEKPAPKPPR